MDGKESHEDKTENPAGASQELGAGWEGGLGLVLKLTNLASPANN